jgi:DNA replication protein DnaD
MISTSEYTEYFSVMETYGIKPDAMLMIVQYCTDRKGSDIGYRYILKVAKDFGNRGICTVSAVEKELSSYVAGTALIQQILSTLSLRRQPDIDDANLLKKWMKELNFDPECIVFAASKLKKGNMEKLDKFLLELYSTKSFSKEEIAEYTVKKQAVYDLAVKINKALSIYVEVLEPVIDNYLNKWLSFGFDQDTLLLIATTCFKKGKNTLLDMDELVETLRNRGFVDLTSVGDYFENEKKVDEFISKILATAGVSRRPNPWDRENLSMWKSWNFTEDMILEAAKISAGKSSPTAYMNGVLSSWKNKGIFTVDGLSGNETRTDNSTESYNREYEKRRMIAHSRAQKNVTAAQELEGFNEINARLNSIEKDLAFAEI